MKRKLQSITKILYPLTAVILILAVWQTVCSLGLVPGFLLPSPIDVVKALFSDFPLIADHAGVTLLETFIGLLLGILLGFVLALLMDRFHWMYKSVYPLIIVTQTIPTVAIAPLLVLWFGYEMLPKIILIVIVVFFPISIGLFDGLRSADKDTINLLRSMGAGKMQIFRYVKLPGAMGQFFAGLKISVSYAVVGAVISEWLGGFKGLGVYMTRVKKAYSFDKMFAVIFLISAISLFLMWLVKFLQRKFMPWQIKEKTGDHYD